MECSLYVKLDKVSILYTFTATTKYFSRKKEPSGHPLLIMNERNVFEASI